MFLKSTGSTSRVTAGRVSVTTVVAPSLLQARPLNYVAPTEPPIDILEVFIWGAGGGGGRIGGWNFGSPGGAGGAAFATFDFIKNQTLYIVVGSGGVPGITTFGFGNGGRNYIGTTDNQYGSAGGGYSGLFISNSYTQANALVMAGGGGGGGSATTLGTSNNVGGAGGGIAGEIGISAYNSATSYQGNPGTQTAAGSDASSDSANVAGSQAAMTGGNPRTNSYGGGGGGGYFGGSAGGYLTAGSMAGGGGGSGYLNTARIKSGILYPGSKGVPGNSSFFLRGSAGEPGIGSNTQLTTNIFPRMTGKDGLVIIRYRGTQQAVGSTGSTVTNINGSTYHIFPGAGAYTFQTVT